MTYPKRKPNRLKNYDYSTPACYFVTVCTAGRKNVLCKIVGEGLCALPSVELSDIGEKVKDSIEYIANHYHGVRIDKYVIMPNHIHLLVNLSCETGGHGSPPLQNIIGQMKSYTTKLYEKSLWQRSFHDHIIRDEKDYQKIWEYIDTNPIKWELDCFYNESVT